MAHNANTHAHNINTRAFGIVVHMFVYVYTYYVWHKRALRVTRKGAKHITHAHLRMDMRWTCVTTFVSFIQPEHARHNRAPISR